MAWKNKWFVVLANGHMTKIFSCKRNMHKLFKKGIFEEYRLCESKEQAEELCKIYNTTEEN